MSKFEKLTDLLDKLNNDEFGTWHHDTEHKGTKEDPVQFPFPVYTEAVHELIDAVYEFIEDHPEYQLRHYYEVMERYGLKNLQDADIDSLNDEAVLALLTWVIRGERFCDGLILGNLKEGRIQHLLRRLKELDSCS